MRMLGRTTTRRLWPSRTTLLSSLALLVTSFSTVTRRSFPTNTMSLSAFPRLTSLGQDVPSDLVEKGQGYLDVHCHLIHERFDGKEDEIAIECIRQEMDHVIVNGIEPISNRRILDYCERYKPCLLPAVGIYPLDAACHFIYSEEQVETLRSQRGAGDEDNQLPLPVVNWKHEFPPPTRFDVDAEIAWIEELAKERKIIAVGECGLDRHYLNDELSMQEQERVLRRLLRIAKEQDIPVILHTRKAEQRVFDLLQEEGVVKADFHCFGGKVKLGQKIAEAGYYLSIPSAIANGDANSSFKKLAQALPLNRILTETDSPYMGPVKGEDNTPWTVKQSVATIAQIKGLTEEEVRSQIRTNFRTLFGI